MKKSKALIVLTLVLACVFVFAACSSPSTSESSSAAPSESATEAPSESSEAPAESSDAPSESSEAPSEGAEATSAGLNDLPTPEDITIPEGETITVGYLAQNQTDQFNVFMGEALMDEAAKYNGQVVVEISDAQSVAATQVSQAENMVVKGMDVVIINAVDQEACAPAVKAVVDAGIPIIILNTLVSNTDIATAYVGVDDVEAGVTAMQIMGDGLDGQGTVNVILGLLGHPASENRWTGVQAELANYPDITIGASQAADWDRGKAMNVTEDWISGGVDFQGIIALNDEMAISASNALSAANITDVKIVGVDALDEALELVKSGKMYGTVYQDAGGQGRGSLNVAVAAVLGMDLHNEYLIPFQKVTAENADDYMGLLSGD